MDIDHFYGLLQDLTETPYPSANHYRYQPPLQTTARPLPPTMYYTTLYSMADLRKQVNKGQEKWRQEVDLTSITDVNNYIKFKVLEYKYFKLINDNLWEQYQEDFADFIKAIFKTCNCIAIYNL